MDALKGLELISARIGSRADYVQGGGGNTSAKPDARQMAVKASGFTLRQVTQTAGYVMLDYAAIKDYFDNITIDGDKDYDKEGGEYVRSVIIGEASIRPSVEAGFHSLLGKFVAHSHSVYANLLCCAQGGEDIAAKCAADYDFLWMPYVNPGFYLTHEMNAMIKQRGRIPDVVFMENHGVIVNGEDAEQTVRLHDQINETIIEYLGVEHAPHSVQLARSGDGFCSETPLLKSRGISPVMFDQTILYPDQLVYLNSGLDKISISDEGIFYACMEKEALTIEETLAAYIYVVDTIKKLGKQIKTMPQSGIDFINGWESEKYRKSLTK